MFTEDYYKMSWQKGGHCKDSYRILKVPDNNLPCRARLSGYEPRTTAWGQTVLACHHPGMNRSLVRRQEAHVKRHPVILHHHHPAFCHSHSHRCGWRVLAPWGLGVKMSAGTGSFSLADRRRGHWTVSSPSALLRAISLTCGINLRLMV